jgi:hypothetical protein
MVTSADPSNGFGSSQGGYIPSSQYVGGNGQPGSLGPREYSSV